MDNPNSFPNEIFTESVKKSSSSSTTYDEANDLTLIANNVIHHELEKIGTVRTEKYDPEHGGLDHVEIIKTSKVLEICAFVLTYVNHFTSRRNHG